jgi:hypothetical protein
MPYKITYRRRIPNPYIKPYTATKDTPAGAWELVRQLQESDEEIEIIDPSCEL